MCAVPCQAQTEAVFISHAATDPLACWDAGLVARLTATHQPVTTCLSGCSAYVSLYFYQFGSLLLTAFLSSRQTTCMGVSVLSLWTFPVQLHFFLRPSQSCCTSCRAVSLSSSSLIVFCHSIWLSGFPAEGCLDRCWITRTPQTHHSHTRTVMRKEGERKGEGERCDR